MAIVGVDSGSLYRRTHCLSRLAWSWVGGRLAPFYIHQNELSELSQWLCHDDSTINIVLDIIIIIIIITRSFSAEAKSATTKHLYRVSSYNTHHYLQMLSQNNMQVFRNKCNDCTYMLQLQLIIRYYLRRRKR